MHTVWSLPECSSLSSLEANSKRSGHIEAEGDKAGLPGIHSCAGTWKRGRWWDSYWHLRANLISIALRASHSHQYCTPDSKQAST